VDFDVTAAAAMVGVVPLSTERDEFYPTSLRGAPATKQSRMARIERWIASLALAMTAFRHFPDLIRQSMRFRELSMDHRVKPGGDDVGWADQSEAHADCVVEAKTWVHDAPRLSSPDAPYAGETTTAFRFA
jgi:hypothetical protein